MTNRRLPAIRPVSPSVGPGRGTASPAGRPTDPARPDPCWPGPAWPGPAGRGSGRGSAGRGSALGGSATGVASGLVRGVMWSACGLAADAGRLLSIAARLVTPTPPSAARRLVVHPIMFYDNRDITCPGGDVSLDIGQGNPVTHRYGWERYPGGNHSMDPQFPAG